MTVAIVWLPTEGRYGRLVKRRAYTSTVEVEQPDGVELVEIENDDIVILWEEENDEE